MKNATLAVLAVLITPTAYAQNPINEASSYLAAQGARIAALQTLAYECETKIKNSGDSRCKDVVLGKARSYIKELNSSKNSTVTAIVLGDNLNSLNISLTEMKNAQKIKNPENYKEFMASMDNFQIQLDNCDLDVDCVNRIQSKLSKIQQPERLAGSKQSADMIESLSSMKQRTRRRVYYIEEQSKIARREAASVAFKAKAAQEKADWETAKTNIDIKIDKMCKGFKGIINGEPEHFI